MLQPPRDLRETFTLLAHLHPGEPFETFLDRVDWTGVMPQQLSYAVQGRLQEGIHYAGLTAAPFEPRAYFTALLLRPQFQSNIVSNILGAFPEKRRCFFIHVPRCGGTSLGETLAQHACTIPHNTIGADWATGRVFLDHVADICRAIPGHDAIHVSGHYPLRFVIEERLSRFGDSIWTSVRPPREIVLSYMNYILTVLHEDPELTRPDTRLWSGLLELDMPFRDLSDARRRGLLQHMAGNRRLIPTDPLSNFLGDGTAVSAMDLLASTDAELIDSARLDHWRAQRWEVAAPPRRNVSTSFFGWEALGTTERRRIEGLIREDLVLHAAITDAIGDDISVRGMGVVGFRGSAPPAPPVVPAGRVKRAARPILRNPGFHRLKHGAVGWTDPPLDYRTIETTLRFPLLDTRIRVRFARRVPDKPCWIARVSAWWRKRRTRPA